jgi:hypothetical protein
MAFNEQPLPTAVLSKWMTPSERSVWPRVDDQTDTPNLRKQDHL